MTETSVKVSTKSASRARSGKDAASHLLRCQACGCIMHDTLLCCPNSHLTCCSGAQCRVCRQPLLPPSAFTQALLRLAAADPQVACRHAGCAERLPPRHLAAHERACPLRPARCLVLPRQCCWSGQWLALEQHTSLQHPEHVLRMPGENLASARWHLSKKGFLVDYMRHLVLALGEMFIYQKVFEFNKGFLYIAIQLVGPPEVSRRYQYKFKMTQGNGGHSVSFKHVVHSEDEDLELAVNHGDCIKVPYSTITDFSKGDRLVVLSRRRDKSPSQIIKQ